MAQPLSVTLLEPAGGPIALQAARAFAEVGALCRLVTTVVDRPDSIVQRGLCRLAGLAGYDLARQFRRRATADIPARKVLAYPWRELCRQATSRLDRTRVMTDRVWEWAETGFDRWVARHGLRGATAVYGYEHACRSSFEEGRRRGLLCVYDVPAAEHEFTHQLLERESEIHPELCDSYRQHVRQRPLHLRRTERRRREWAAADVVIAASAFTRDSYSGYPGADKVRVIPYGAPPPDPSSVDGGSKGDGPLRVLWAGTFSPRKGAHYLIEAWRRAGLTEREATLDHYGAVTLPPGMAGQAPPQFHFRGSVPREELFDAYRAADVFVFPTLCDGFGMVVTEAFSRGLPVVTTRNAGAADLVRHGENGLLVGAGDADRLAEALRWCVSNRAALRAMRSAALATAAGWQWADYRAALRSTILERYRRA
jgi:glycosyltransferase involved in cell wall biosynthesis